MVKKISTKLNLTTRFYKKGNITNNYKDKICYVCLTSISDGQKSFEEFSSKKENILDDDDESICKVDLLSYDNGVDDILNKILKSNDIDKLKKFLSIKFKNYQPPKKYIKVSRTI